MIRSENAHLQVVAQTHPGMSGKNNEDRYAVTAYRLGRKNGTPALLAVLCDGIGGHRAGEVAAEVAVNIITQTVAESDGGHPVDILEKAISEASDSIYSMAQSDTNQYGMGATCVCAWIIDQHLYAATVGDSRIYLVRGQDIQQLSTDHTWIQEALDSGILKPDEAAGHPNAHVIRRYLGSPNPPQADFRLHLTDETTQSQNDSNQGIDLLPGDQLLLCSDGLTDLVNDAAILNTLKASSPNQAVESLIEQANAQGGHDNITVVLLTAPSRAVRAAIGRIRWAWVAAGCVGIALIALLAGFILVSLGVLSVSREVASTPTPTSTLPPLLQTALPGNLPVAPSPMAPLSTPTQMPVMPTLGIPTAANHSLTSVPAAFGVAAPGG